MKYKTFGEATDEVHSVMDIFMESLEPNIAIKRGLITDVSLIAMTALFRCLPGYKQFFLPGEVDKNKIVIVFYPAENHVITITSEPVINYTVINNKINLN